MKAVARLVWTYFTGTPVLRAFTFGGLVLIAVDLYVLVTQPQSGEMLWLAVLGLIAFFFGSSLMPVMFGRLARSHSIGVLPGGRVKLLVSAFVTIVLVALPVGVMAPAAFVIGQRQSSGTHERSAGARLRPRVARSCSPRRCCSRAGCTSRCGS